MNRTKRKDTGMSSVVMTIVSLVISAFVVFAMATEPYSEANAKNTTYKLWTVGDSQSGSASAYECVCAFMMVHADLENDDPTKFNPDYYSKRCKSIKNCDMTTSSFNGYSWFDYVRKSDGSVEGAEVQFKKSWSKNLASYIELGNSIVENTKKGYYIMLTVDVVDGDNSYYAIDHVSGENIYLYDPTGKASQLPDLKLVDTKKELVVSAFCLKAVNPGKWVKKYQTVTTTKKPSAPVTTTTAKPSTPTTTTYTPVLVTGSYYIKNSSTGSYMNVVGGKDTNAANIGLAANTGSNAFIMNVSAVKSGNAAKGTAITPALSSTRVVNAYADNVKNGTDVNLYTKDSTTSQQWIWEKVSGGYIIHNAQKPDLVLTADGTNVCVKTNTKAKTQIWTVESAFKVQEVSGKYYLRNKGTGKYMYVAGTANTNASNIGLAAKKTTTAFQMNISPVTKGNPLKGSYITPASGSKVVNPYSDTPSDGTNVTLYTKNTDGTQYWIFEPVSGGYIIHNNYNKNLVLNANGTNVNIATKSSSNNQIWILEKVETAVTTTKPAATTVKTTAKPAETTTTTTAAPVPIKGDVNSDGVQDSKDIAIVQDFILGKSEFENWQNADMNDDNVIDVFDLILIRKSILKF